MKKLCLVCSICFISLLCLLSCGLEEFFYIDYISQGDMEDTTRARVHLPSGSSEGYNFFDNFIIFYKIYISGENRTGKIETTDERSLINATLNTDYNSLYSHTDITSTTVNTSNIATIFYNRRYFKLELEGVNIDDVLSRGSLGNTLEIFFPFNTGVKPTIIINENSYVLYRAVEGPSIKFNPKPDDPDNFRYFLNHPELYNTANVSSDINADTATNTKTNPELRYTYVSMYIAAMGRSREMPPRIIYSQPTFIGIFRLADWS